MKKLKLYHIVRTLIFPQILTLTQFQVIMTFFQKLVKHISNIHERDLSKTKAKIRNTCEKYYKVKVFYRHRNVVLELSKKKTLLF